MVIPAGRPPRSPLGSPSAAIEHGFAGTLLQEELIELVDLRADLLLGFSAMTTSWQFFAV